jgi:hypothetical protein
LPARSGARLTISACGSAGAVAANGVGANYRSGGVTALARIRSAIALVLSDMAWA